MGGGCRHRYPPPLPIKDCLEHSKQPLESPKRFEILTSKIVLPTSTDDFFHLYKSLHARSSYEYDLAYQHHIDC